MKADKVQCPECLEEVTQEELDTFGGLCEECGSNYDVNAIKPDTE